jgi:hypothetical protein|tara:strand:- start:243 stop:470 length:228 start_codon:yes stop_codon:yes gene_type:complete
MEIKTVQSGQGLLSVEIDNKPTDYKISNNNGVWKMYRVENSDVGFLQFSRNLSRIIHNPKKLSCYVQKQLREIAN